MQTVYLGAVLCLALAACSHHSADTADATPVAVVGAQTALVGRQTFTETIHAIGTVSARPGHIVVLSAPSPTRVTRIWVTVGQHVAENAPLIAFDRQAIEAQAHSAEVARDVAQHAYDRVKQLADIGGVPRKDVEDAGAQLAQTQAAAVAAQRARQYATLQSPITGTVTRLDVELGSPVDVNQSVVEVVDPTRLDIMFTVAPETAARIRIGATVDIEVPGQSTVEHATVADVSAAVDTGSGGVLIRARMDREVAALRVGQTVNGDIVVATHPRAVVVPAEALVPADEGLKVFVLDSTHHAHATPVAVGARRDTLVEIVHGLNGGETIVTAGAYGVDDSALVKPR